MVIYPDEQELQHKDQEKRARILDKDFFGLNGIKSVGPKYEQYVAGI